MVANGEASVADIERSISQGSGLQWASMGPIFALHLAAGEGGMHSFFEKLPHDHEEPYIRLDAPEMTNALRQALIEETPVDSMVVEFRGPDGGLLGTCLVDQMHDGLSAVYSFFDPGQARRSLGTYMILWLIERAHGLDLPYVYLGYWIEGSS